MSLPMLSGTGLIKRLGGRDVLCGVDIGIRPSSATVVVGPNGAGKSVLVRALALIDAPDKGRVAIDGVEYRFPLRGAPQPPPWPGITVCFQQLFMWPHLTFRKAITLVTRSAPNAANAAEISDLADALGILHLLDRYPGQCSVGERQRGALLRALALNPRYLLCDEVTSALDTEASYAVLGVLRQAMSRGMGLLVVSHQLGFASKLGSTEVCFLERGRILETGGPEILQSPRTERIRRFVEIMESDTDSIPHEQTTQQGS